MKIYILIFLILQNKYCNSKSKQFHINNLKLYRIKIFATIENKRNDSMSKVFNVTGLCRPEQHYMINLDSRLKEIKKLIDTGCYFTINRARQYGKTTILFALKEYLKEEYIPVFMDFQRFETGDFLYENTFSITFAEMFLEELKINNGIKNQKLKDKIQLLNRKMSALERGFNLRRLFRYLSTICEVSDKPIVLMIDEVDSATNNQVFLDFLSQLRAYYLSRDYHPTFQSVILVGVNDVKNLGKTIRLEEGNRLNSPWNIATLFLSLFLKNSYQS